MTFQDVPDGLITHLVTEGRQCAGEPVKWLKFGCPACFGTGINEHATCNRLPPSELPAESDVDAVVILLGDHTILIPRQLQMAMNELGASPSKGSVSPLRLYKDG